MLMDLKSILLGLPIPLGFYIQISEHSWDLISQLNSTDSNTDLIIHHQNLLSVCSVNDTLIHGTSRPETLEPWFSTVGDYNPQESFSNVWTHVYLSKLQGRGVTGI